VGLEPVHRDSPSNEAAALVTDHAPMFVREILEGPDVEKGFSIEDAVMMVAMLEELAAHASRETLQGIQRRRLAPSDEMTEHEFDGLMENYFIHWLMGNDTESIAMLEANTSLVEESFEDWADLVHFLRGLRLSFQHSSRREMTKERPAGAWRPLSSTYSMADAEAAAGAMTLTFGSFWHTECVRVKSSLLDLDHNGKGRVRLSDFHGAALDGEWRFSESKEYLRDLGALDESSPLLGPHVIVANYLYGASNCIVTDAHYRICCRSECEHHLFEIEDAVRSPLATPEQLLAIVGNITMDLDDNEPKLTNSLRSQLHDIANTHDGQVPIHGRLFAQWLHYMFPQDCPFPHKAGTVSSMTPLEYGDDYMASDHEIERHAAESMTKADGDDAAAQLIGRQADDDEWMTQWSKDEELLTDNIKLHAPWQRRFPPAASTLSAVFALACLGALGKVWFQGSNGIFSPRAGDGKVSDFQSFCTKAHYV